MSSRIKLLGLVVIAALTVAIIYTATTGPSGQSGSSTSPGPTSSRPSPTPGLPAERVATTYLDQSLGEGAPPAPTGDKAQSKLWIAADAWWAVMVEPQSGTFHIYELVDGGKSWRDTGTNVDERRSAQPDTLWDGKHLYIVSGARSKSASGAARLLRYSFDAKARRFDLDPNFPIRITDTGVDSIVLAQDGTGKLWATYVADDGQVVVNRTLGDDLFWGKGFPLPVTGSHVTPDDVADVLALGPGRIAVMWSSLGDGAFYLTIHQDGDPDEAWSAPETAIAGRGMANNQLKTVASADGRLFALVRTALDRDPGSTGQDPQLVLLERRLDGSWASTLFGRIRDQHTSPLVALDASAGIVYAMGTTPKTGGAIYYKRTREDQPSFPAGEGSPVVADPNAPQTTGGTSTKDAVGPDTGLVVLAYDPTTTRYLHGVIDLGGGIAAGTSPATGSTIAPQTVFEDDFNPWPAGPNPNLGWELRDTDPPRSFTIRKDPTATNKSASLSAPASAGDVRACKTFPPVNQGQLTVDVRVRLTRAGPEDAVLTDVHGAAAQAANVRFGRNGAFAYIKGPNKIRTTVRWTPGAWYRSIVVVHFGSRTYDWRVLNGAGRRLLEVRGIPWRDVTTTLMDRVCMRAPGGAGVVLEWDDIRVIR